MSNLDPKKQTWLVKPRAEGHIRPPTERRTTGIDEFPLMVDLLSGVDVFGGRRGLGLKNIALTTLKRRRCPLQLGSFSCGSQTSVKSSPTLRLTPRPAPLTYSSTVWIELKRGEGARPAPDLPRLWQEHAPEPRDSSPPASCCSLQIYFAGEAGQRTDKPASVCRTLVSLCSATAVRPPRELSINPALIKNSSCYLRLGCVFPFSPSFLCWFC